ncbi:hypothetical protein WBG78_27505 [Chryseolinea sp. T2]|uniref:hypothetical protein n=1 Tax=Chryseolinea sp. T2 TaxID=3129255 RepID=UPI003076AC35
MAYKVESALKRLLCGMMIVGMVACDDDTDPGPAPEPEIFPFRYLSVEVRTPLEPKGIAEITFHADDLKSYGYVLWQSGTRRIQCASNSFIDADDEKVTEDSNSVTYKTDEDVIFDVVDINGNITRFTPSITGATSLLIHGAGTVLSGSELSTYVSDVTREINKMPNTVYEVN